MKRTIVALIIAALALTVGAGESIYLSANTDSYIEMLDKADSLVEKNEMAEAAETVKRLDNRFLNDSRIYDMLMFHSDVDDISASLASLQRYAYAGDISEFLAASARIKRILVFMKKMRVPRLENIL